MDAENTSFEQRRRFAPLAGACLALLLGGCTAYVVRPLDALYYSPELDRSQAQRLAAEDRRRRIDAAQYLARRLAAGYASQPGLTAALNLLVMPGLALRYGRFAAGAGD